MQNKPEIANFDILTPEPEKYDQLQILVEGEVNKLSLLINMAFEKVKKYSTDTPIINLLVAVFG